MGDFNIHDFLKATILGLIGNRPDFTIREMAMGWYSKGVFTTDDVAEIETAISAQYPEVAEDNEEVDEPVVDEVAENE